MNCTKIYECCPRLKSKGISKHVCEKYTGTDFQAQHSVKWLHLYSWYCLTVLKRKFPELPLTLNTSQAAFPSSFTIFSRMSSLLHLSFCFVLQVVASPSLNLHPGRPMLGVTGDCWYVRNMVVSFAETDWVRAAPISVTRTPVVLRSVLVVPKKSLLLYKNR